MRSLLPISLLLAVACSRKEVDPIDRLCKHAVEVCGQLANYDACVASVRSLRAIDLESALAAEACALERNNCQEILMCGSRPAGKKLKGAAMHMKSKASAAARGAVGEAAAKVEELQAKP
jgi:hypothetical protein